MADTVRVVVGVARVTVVIHKTQIIPSVARIIVGIGLAQLHPFLLYDIKKVAIYYLKTVLKYTPCQNLLFTNKYFYPFFLYNDFTH